MAIQHRRGAYANLDPTKAVPGEVLVVLQDDPTSDDGKAAYMTFAAGDIKRMATYDEVEHFNEESKDYADDAKEYRDDAQSALSTIQSLASQVSDDADTVSDAVTSVTSTASAALSSIDSAKNTALNGIETASQSGINSISSEATAAINSVQSKIDEIAEPFIKVQDTQPIEEDNKIWVKETPQAEVSVPTYEEFEEVKSALEDLISIDKSTGTKLVSYISSSGNIAADEHCKLVYFACFSNTSYTVNKTASARFRVGYTATVPTNGMTVSGLIADNTATSIKISTGETAKYLVIYYYDSQNDTLTESDIYDSLAITYLTAADLVARGTKIDKQQNVADAGKAMIVGDDGILAPTEISAGLSDGAKIALLNCFQHVAWADANGQDYCNALEYALYEAVDTSYINVVYSAKSWGKYAGDSVNTLKTDLIVTYYARQGAVGVIVPAENYTLTGSMVAGLQSFTVIYRGKIATFNAQILNGLPSGYTKLQYVQTDGRQYIDTGISETQVDSAIYKMRVTGIAAGTDSYASGQHFFSSANFYFPFLKNNTSGEVTVRRFGNERVSSGSKALAWDKDIDYEIKAYIDNDAVFVNGQQLYEIAAGSTKDSTKKMHLFTFGGYPEMEKFRFCGRFYGLTVYGQTEDVVLSLIPAKNASNVVGVYDAISGSFFTSNTAYPLQAGEVA